MPQKLLTDEQLIETLQAVEDAGSVRAAARVLNIDRQTVKHRLNRAREAGLHLSDGARQATQRAGLSGAEARAGWRVIVDPETGSRDSTYWRAPEQPVDTETLIEQVRAAFDDIRPINPIPAPSVVSDDLAALVPITDLHAGMHAWGAETMGEDYDLRLMASDLDRAFARVTARIPACAEAIVLLNGDTLHADDNRAETPAHRHKLDVDTRHRKVVGATIEVIARQVEAAAAKHARVIVRVLRGNHDEHSHLILAFALAQRYRLDPRIDVDMRDSDLFFRQWGRCLIAAHHGDKAPPERLTLYLSDVCEFWSATRHRYCFTGHVHKDQARDVGPLRWESLRAFCPPDAYAAGMGYAARRALQALVFDRRDGLVLRAIDPIDRGV